MSAAYQLYNWGRTADEAVKASMPFGYTVVLHGPPDSGKSRYCVRFTESTWVSAGPIHRYRLSGEKDPADELRLLKESFSRAGLPGEGRARLRGPLAQSITEDIGTAGTRLLVLDDADLGGADFLRAVFRAVDDLALKKLKCGLLLTGKSPLAHWANYCGAGSRRIYRHIEIPRLNAISGCLLLTKLCLGTKLAHSAFKSKDPDIVDAVSRLHDHTHGNFRALEQFANTKNLYFKHEKFSRALVLKIVAKLEVPFFLEAEDSNLVKGRAR